MSGWPSSPFKCLTASCLYIGVRTFGAWIEANPLVAWYAATFGPAVAFTAVKLFAVACGTVLYLMARHRTVAALTLFYLAFAVGPWVHVSRTLQHVLGTRHYNADMYSAFLWTHSYLRWLVILAGLVVIARAISGITGAVTGCLPTPPPYAGSASAWICSS